MLENLKKLFEDFDFRLPTSLNDITVGFLTVVACTVALVAIIISVCILSKKKKRRLRLAAQAEEAAREPKRIPSKFIPEEKNREIREKLVDPEIEKEEPLPQAAIKADISYTTSFEPVKGNMRPARKPQPAAQVFAAEKNKSREAHGNTAAPSMNREERDIVRVEDGFVTITPEQKTKLEKAYSAALRRCAVNGTSSDLENLLDAKRLLNQHKIPQQDFEALLNLLFPKVKN